MNSSKYQILSGGGKRLKKSPSKNIKGLRSQKITVNSVCGYHFTSQAINAVCRDHQESQEGNLWYLLISFMECRGIPMSVNLEFQYLNKNPVISSCRHLPQITSATTSPPLWAHRIHGPWSPQEQTLKQEQPSAAAANEHLKYSSSAPSSFLYFQRLPANLQKKNKYV